MTPQLAPAKGYFDGTHIVLTSPVHFARGQEVLVTPAKRSAPPPESFPSPEEIDAIVDSLVGAIPDSGKTLEEYREERLEKHENPR